MDRQQIAKALTEGLLKGIEQQHPNMVRECAAALQGIGPKLASEAFPGGPWRDAPCPNCEGPWEATSMSFCLRCRYEHESLRRVELEMRAADVLAAWDALIATARPNGEPMLAQSDAVFEAMRAMRIELRLVRGEKEPEAKP